MIFSQIFIKISSLKEAIHQKIHSKAKYLSAFSVRFFFGFLICIVLLICCSCGTTRNVAIVDRVHQDTIYLNKVQYDSIFINQYHAIDRGSDTIYIQDVKVEYRYKLLRDTVYKFKVDSIPVIKEVEVTKEVRYIPWWSKVLNWIGAVSLFAIIVIVIVYAVKLSINHKP